MNRYALAFVLGLLFACPDSPALAAQSLSEKDTENAMKMLGEAGKKLDAAQRASERDM